MQNGAGQDFRIRFDAETGIVRVSLRGDMPDEAFVQYRDAMAGALEQAHAVAPAARVLIDGRDMENMPANAADRIAELGLMFTCEDRVAMIVRSSLLKIEARRVAHSDAVQTFLSENAARTWLMAYSVPNATAA